MTLIDIGGQTGPHRHCHCHVGAGTSGCKDFAANRRWCDAANHPATASWPDAGMYSAEAKRKCAAGQHHTRTTATTNSNCYSYTKDIIITFFESTKTLSRSINTASVPWL